MASETPFQQQALIGNIPNVDPPPQAGSGPSQDDVISARVQRSNIAIIQMAPPAPGSSSSSASASSSAAGTVPVPVPVPNTGPAPVPSTSISGNRRTAVGGGVERPVKQKKLHHCSVQGCTYNTGHTKDLTRHMRKHTGEKPFRCDRCSKCYTRYDKLVMHIRVHEGIKPFSCPRCQYAATDSSSLKKHVRTHGNERPYKCHLCPYASKSSSQLVVHIRRHTGDSPYICTISGCDASFKTASDLNRHMRLHTGEKPFKCQYCDYRSAVKSNLTLHLNVHTNPNSRKRRKEAAMRQGGEGEEDPFLEDVEDNPGPGDNQPNANVLPFQYSCKFCDHKADTIELFTLHLKESHPGLSHTKKTGRQRLLNQNGPGPANFHCSSCQVGFVSETSLMCHMRQHGTVPNKPANVNPEIYSPTPCSSNKIQRPLPENIIQPQPYRNYEHVPVPPPPVVQERTPYSLTELQKLPLVHSSVITENPSVITNNSGPNPMSMAPPGTGKIVQHHHYDEEAGHLYVITYNHIESEEGDVGASPDNQVNYIVENSLNSAYGN